MRTPSECVVIFSALADETRLRILNLLRHAEICVNLLMIVLNENQPKISRHLLVLKKAGLVDNRRDGKWIHYRFVSPSDEYVRAILNNLTNWMNCSEKMRKDIQKLQELCSKPEFKLPKPNISDKAHILNQPQKSSLTNENEALAERRELEIFLL